MFWSKHKFTPKIFRTKIGAKLKTLCIGYVRHRDAMSYIWTYISV